MGEPITHSAKLSGEPIRRREKWALRALGTGRRPAHATAALGAALRPVMLGSVQGSRQAPGAHCVEAKRRPSGLNASAMVERGEGSSSQLNERQRLSEMSSTHRCRRRSPEPSAGTASAPLHERLCWRVAPPQSSRSRRRCTTLSGLHSGIQTRLFGGRGEGGLATQCTSTAGHHASRNVSTVVACSSLAVPARMRERVRHGGAASRSNELVRHSCKFVPRKAKNAVGVSPTGSQNALSGRFTSVAFPRVRQTYYRPRLSRYILLIRDCPLSPGAVRSPHARAFTPCSQTNTKYGPFGKMAIWPRSSGDNPVPSTFRRSQRGQYGCQLLHLEARVTS